MATNYLFPKFRIFRRNSKATRDRHMVTGKDVGNFVFCRMAPSVVTLGDPESQNCFRFLLLLRVRFAQKVRDRLSPFFLHLVGLPALMTYAKLGCYPSRNVATVTRFRHFRTISAEADAIFVLLGLHSLDVMYSGELVVDSFQIVELLRI